MKMMILVIRLRSTKRLLKTGMNHYGNVSSVHLHAQQWDNELRHNDDNKCAAVRSSGALLQCVATPASHAGQTRMCCAVTDDTPPLAIVCGQNVTRGRWSPSPKVWHRTRVPFLCLRVYLRSRCTRSRYSHRSEPQSRKSHGEAQPVTPCGEHVLEAQVFV